MPKRASWRVSAAPPRDHALGLVAPGADPVEADEGLAGACAWDEAVDESECVRGRVLLGPLEDGRPGAAVDMRRGGRAGWGRRTRRRGVGVCYGPKLVRRVRSCVRE